MGWVFSSEMGLLFDTTDNFIIGCYTTEKDRDELRGNWREFASDPNADQLQATLKPLKSPSAIAPSKLHGLASFSTSSSRRI